MKKQIKEKINQKYKQLTKNKKNHKKKENILIFAAHPDDEVFGCGGTIAKYSKKGYNVDSYIVSYGEKANIMQKENKIIKTRINESIKAGKILGSNTHFMKYKESDFEKENFNITEKIYKIIKNKKPVKIYTHTRNDKHNIHSEVGRQTINAVKKYTNELIKNNSKIKLPEVYSYDIWGDTIFSTLTSQSIRFPKELKKIFNNTKIKKENYKKNILGTTIYYYDKSFNTIFQLSKLPLNIILDIAEGTADSITKSIKTINNSIKGTELEKNYTYEDITPYKKLKKKALKQFKSQISSYWILFEKQTLEPWSYGQTIKNKNPELIDKESIQYHKKRKNINKIKKYGLIGSAITLGLYTYPKETIAISSLALLTKGLTTYARKIKKEKKDFENYYFEKFKKEY
jgi:LmbE family N-acetylglucosaminyl deacetylase